MYHRRRRHAAARPRRSRASAAEAGPADGRRRVVVERVRPEVDGGRFPIKRTIGESVRVTALIHADGHDLVAAALRYRPAPARGRRSTWFEAPMQPLGNDEWTASFRIERQCPYEYTVHAWIDRFASWRTELLAKVAAGQDVSSELLEGATLLRAAGERARASRARKEARWLGAQADLIGGTTGMVDRARAALDESLARSVGRVPDRRHTAPYDRVLTVSVDRERARVGAWYEIFPRSWGPDPTRSATFREAEAHLPRIAAMGFDVVYLTPIHPIGTSFRKGRGNALTAESGDPGSPWAIGSEAGGHKAVDPGLGTLEDFDHFAGEARRLGLEVALDLAFQCSPDHPYVREHPEWFGHRPDGTIKYAENPPKKYQDIYPFDFECEAWPALWAELKSIVEFWIARGVMIFRVDNPHTKPYRFWEWLIRDIREQYPDVIFLAEAFTRPTVMYYIAKLGFTQSYTYFTWRNTKDELTDYFTEVTGTEVMEFFRPNLFANTPDILHAYLQQGGPPAFRVRLVLAATLGASYGIYSGFELCENRAVPGTEEYLDSEKYQHRRWDCDRPGHIRDLVAAVNRIRHENPALQSDDHLTFCKTDNPRLIAFCKRALDCSNVILVVVNLDPEHVQQGWIEVPLDLIDPSQRDTYEVTDLLDGARYTWCGELTYVRLDPRLSPAHIMRLPVAAPATQIPEHIAFLQSAATLGQRTAELHLALGADDRDPAFAPETLSAEHFAALVTHLELDADRALTLLTERLDSLPRPARDRARAILDARALLPVLISTFTTIPAGSRRIRVHGDYHLGQVLCAGQDFVIIDFEGEPARPLAERRAKQSPLKDVAGMLRSFSYVAHATLLTESERHPDRVQRFEARARLWETSVSTAFVKRYRETMARGALVPSDDETFDRLLDIFVLEKALYEMRYELASRPAWVDVPLLGILRILNARDAWGHIR